MGNYKKQVRGENISADEIAAHNHIQIFNDGSGRIIVCFCIVLMTAALVYLWFMVHLLIVLIIIGSSILACVIGVSATWRHVSHTRKEHLVNESEIQWSKILYKTETLVATLNRRTGVVEVHNAQEVSIQHHHAAPLQISENASFDDDIMPPFKMGNGQ